MVNVSRPYKQRSIRFLQLWNTAGWTVKVYGISAKYQAPPPQLVQAAKAIACQRLPQPAMTDDRYGAAILIVHEGADGDYVLVDWWFGENMLQHHVYAGPEGHTDQLTYVSPQGVGFCVWELSVFAFERQAWIETVLMRPGAPDLDGYFERHLNTTV